MARRISLEAVTPANYAQTLALDVLPEQRRLIAPVVRSLADAFVWHSLVRVARDEHGAPIGFVMLFPFEAEGRPAVNVVRFMVDAHHQRRGLGTALMAQTLEWAATLTPRPECVRISTLPHNTAALALYRKAGFTGDELHDGEVVLWRML